jgi:hypothetical protein
MPPHDPQLEYGPLLTLAQAAFAVRELGVARHALLAAMECAVAARDLERATEALAVARSWRRAVDKQLLPLRFRGLPAEDTDLYELLDDLLTSTQDGLARLRVAKEQVSRRAA